MQQIFKIVSPLVFSIFFLTGCVTTSSLIDPSKKTDIQNIAVASLLGDEFHLIRIGVTVFNNDYGKSDVTDWVVDTFAEQEIQKSLSDRYRAPAKVLPHEPNLRQDYLANADNVFKNNKLARLIQLAKNQGADTLIVITPISKGGAGFMTPGFGYFERHYLHTQRILYVSAILRVVSVKDGNDIAFRRIPASNAGEGIEWKASLDDYSEGQRNQLKTRLFENLSRSIRTSLKELGF